MLNLEYLEKLIQRYRDEYKSTVTEFEVGGRFLNFNSKPVIMGVINLSSDSWYRESVCLTVDRAVRRGKILFEQGADIIDVGAESTLLNAARIDEFTQKSKLLPVLKELNNVKIPVSVESYDYSVISEALKSGASVINLTGTAGTEKIYKLVAEYNAAVIICYVEGKNVREVEDFDIKNNPVNKMLDYFANEIEKALNWGVRKIIIDPGLGFYYRNLQDSAIRVRHQINIFLNSFRFRKLGFPVCNALPHAFEYFGEEVRTAEPFFSVLAALGKTDIFRTHEVAKIKAVLDTMGIFCNED